MDFVHLGLRILGAGGLNLFEIFLVVAWGIWSDRNRLIHGESGRIAQ